MSIKTDTRHLYLQVIDRIKADIQKGIYKENEQLPSENELAKQLGVSRATLREALRVLEEENVIIRRHGVGTFISPRPLFTSGIEQLSSVTDMIKQAGMIPGTILLDSDTERVTDEDMERFSCSSNDEVVIFRRVRTADSEPVVYCVDKVLKKFLTTSTPLDEESLFSMLDKGTEKKIAYAVAEIAPLGYDDEISPLLNCNRGTALLVLRQMHYNEADEPVLYSVNYFRSDKFHFHVLRKRN